MAPVCSRPQSLKNKRIIGHPKRLNKSHDKISKHQNLSNPSVVIDKMKVQNISIGGDPGSRAQQMHKLAELFTGGEAISNNVNKRVIQTHMKGKKLGSKRRITHRGPFHSRIKSENYKILKFNKDSSVGRKLKSKNMKSLYQGSKQVISSGHSPKRT